MIKALTNYRVITLSPGLLNGNSVSLSLSAELVAVLQCLTFSVLEPLAGILSNLLCQGFAHIKFNCNTSVVDPNCVSLLLHPGT